MSSTKTLITIRVPELGPSLGKLTDERFDQSDPLGRDSIRLAMVTKLFSNAGDARRLAASGDRAAAISTLSRESWLSLWEETAMQVSGALIDYASQEIAAEARRVRMPARLKRKLELNDDDGRGVKGRLGSTGSDLVHVLDEIDRTGAVLLNSPATRPEDLEAWQGAQLRAARRLEAAWSELDDAATRELSFWRDARNRVGRWRKSAAPVLIFLILGMALAVWLGLVMGGFIESPAWLTAVWARVFGA